MLLAYQQAALPAIRNASLPDCWQCDLVLIYGTFDVKFCLDGIIYWKGNPMRHVATLFTVILTLSTEASSAELNEQKYRMLVGMTIMLKVQNEICDWGLDKKKVNLIIKRGQDLKSSAGLSEADYEGEVKGLWDTTEAMIRDKEFSCSKQKSNYKIAKDAANRLSTDKGFQGLVDAVAKK